MARPLEKLFSGLPVARVLVTHHHEDHTGNLFRLAQKQIPILAHSRSAALLDEVCIDLPFYRNFIWGRPYPTGLSVLPDEVETTRCSLEVIETPGHAEDHVCFFEPRLRWLFTGDLYLASYLRYLREDENIYEIMESLQRLVNLHPDRLFCNHRGFVADGEKQLAKKLSFLQELRDQVLRSQEEGIPVADFIKKVFRPDRFFRWLSRGEFSTTNLVQAFLKG